eukprot:contig_5918_g1344
MDVLARVLQHTGEALQRDRTAFTEAHVEELCGLLRCLEVLLGAVEQSFFAGRGKGMRLDGVVCGWEAELDALHDKAVSLKKDGAHHFETADRFDQLSKKVSNLGRSIGSRAAEAPDPADIAARFTAPPLDPKYVAGVATPGRAEYALVSELRAYVLGGSGVAPRLGVWAIGGSGKSTACAGVAACDFVRQHFPLGTTWVQLTDGSTVQAVVDAAVALAYRLSGADNAMQLLRLKVDDDVVAEAARHARSVPAADAAQHLVVVDDVLYPKRDLLHLLLRVVPPATPVLFTTRSESVVSLLRAQRVPIDGLPDDDARRLLAQAVGKPVEVGVPPFSPDDVPGWVEEVVHKTQGHALSLMVVSSMIAERDGAWFHVLKELEKRWMEPDFALPDGGLGMQPSVRATLATSLALLPDEASRLAFAGLGILPTSVKVGTPVLARLWRLQMEPGAATAAYSAGRVGGGTGGVMERADVDRQVSQLVRAGLLRREVDVSSGVVDGVIVHPVIGEFAKSLLGDNGRVLHGQLIRDYLAEVNGAGTDECGSRAYPFWKTRDDGYWFNHVAHHAAACGDVSALVSLTQQGWRRARERAGSPLAYQADVEVVLASLLPWVEQADTGNHPTALLVRVYRALAWAYGDRAAGDRAANTEVAVSFWERALALSARETAPLDWAASQNGLGNAYCDRVGGDREANVEAAVARYERALEVRTRDAVPLEWAATQVNLGHAYRDRVGGDRAANVEAAVACYERALEVETRDAAPREWALT